MIGLHQIELGGGDQVLVHVPPFRVDASPAPTVTIEDTTQSTDSPERHLVAAPAATVDPFDEVLTAAAGVGQTDLRRIPCAAGAALVGRRYVLEAEAGESELVELAGRTASVAVATAPLGAAYAAATSRLRGVQLSVVFPEAVAALERLLEDEIPILVRWTYSLAGRRLVVNEQARVVRAIGQAAYVGEVEVLLREEWPELAQQLARDPGALRRLVRSCARRLAIQLRARNIDPDTWLAGPQGLEVLLARCVWRFGEQGLIPKGGVDPTTWSNDARASYLNLWHALVKGGTGRDVAELDRDDMAPAGHSQRRRTLIALK